jgi:hypothetical protein
MMVVLPQSPTEWQGAQCLAELADVILEPEEIGLVEVPVPTRTHGVGLRGHPEHKEGGLGLVGFGGRRMRSPEQAVGGAATAVAREGGSGTAAEQACKKGEKAIRPRPTWACV